MVGRSGGGGGGSAFDYVQDPSPQAPEEGEEWYDTGSNRAFVYDGANWIEQTVVDHGQLSGVTADQHHSPPTSTQSDGVGGGWVTLFSGTQLMDGGTFTRSIGSEQTVTAYRVVYSEYDGYVSSNNTVRVNFSNGRTESAGFSLDSGDSNVALKSYCQSGSAGSVTVVHGSGRFYVNKLEVYLEPVPSHGHQI